MENYNYDYEAQAAEAADEADEQSGSFGLNLVDLLVEAKGGVAGALKAQFDFNDRPLDEFQPTDRSRKPDDAQRMERRHDTGKTAADLIHQLAPGGRTADGALKAILGNPSGPGNFVTGIKQALRLPSLEDKKKK